MAKAKPLTYDEKLELIAAMLVSARALVATLETGETAETDADVDHAIEEARGLARYVRLGNGLS